MPFDPTKPAPGDEAFNALVLGLRR